MTIDTVTVDLVNIARRAARTEAEVTQGGPPTSRDRPPRLYTRLLLPSL